MVFLAGILYAEPKEVSGGIGLSVSGIISEQTGLAAVADVIFDLPYHAVDFDSSYAPIHSWQNIEGPSVGFLISQKVIQAGIGYRNVIRFFEFIPVGYGINVGISSVGTLDQQSSSKQDSGLAPFMKIDGTLLGISLGMDVVLEPKNPKGSGFLIGFRF